jgi:hypothetical protein
MPMNLFKFVCWNQHMVYELYVKIAESNLPNKDDLIKLTVQFIWYVMRSPYVNLYKFIDFVYNTKFDVIVLNSIDPSLSDVGSVTFVNGDPNKLRVTAKLVKWSGVAGIAYNFRTVAHELNHLLYFGLKRGVFKFNATDSQISKCHQVLHNVDVYSYDEKFMVGFKHRVNNVDYNFMVSDPMKIIKYVMT